MITDIDLPIGTSHIFPFFLDYDLDKKKPRGVSCKIDLFSMGILYSAVNGLDCVDNIIYLRKKQLFLKKGLFLVDFKYAGDDFFINAIIKMGFAKVYFGDSNIVDFGAIFNKNKIGEVFIVNFI